MNRKKLASLRLALAALLPLSLSLAAHASPPLPALGADLTQTSVSGLSSGGFMAAQLATAYSASFMGVGVIAAGPYYCAGTYAAVSFMENATTTCMRPSTRATGASATASWANALRFEKAGLIDPVSNLQRQRVYIFSGEKDETVTTTVVEQVAAYYALARTQPAQISYEHNIAAGHSIITANPGDQACAVTAAPYINNCGFTQSQVLLAHIYGQPARPPAAARGQIIRFDQSEFLVGRNTSMDSDAYAYVPADCEQGGCRVHVVLHGCRQGASVIGDHYFRGTGYNEFADNSRLIVLYPQVHPSNGIPANPRGCWDFWGYSSPDRNRPNFYTREAPQMQAIMAMIKRLGQPRNAAIASSSP